MQKEQRVIKHNPLFLTDEELTERFVVRKIELDILKLVMQGNTGSVNQHAVVVAPRGMGKTMLMRRLALLVRSDPDLCQEWYPIVAPEEIYDAASEGEIWLAVLRRLADQERDLDGDFERWSDRYHALLEEGNEKRLRTQALGALLEFSRERGKRLLIMIENLQMILGEQFQKNADWDLRRTLLNHFEIMLILTATTRFEEISAESFASYELFRELKLQPLNTAECQLLWTSVCGQELTRTRIRPMEILTGGNPRLLSILAEFAPGKPLEELLRNLTELIDEHTPFLKSNIDALPPQERRVFVTLARIWEPSTAREVGKCCRLDSNTASAVLKSLVKRGAVVECGREGRRNFYQVAERIYCIYYLLRLSGSESDRMRAFVRFMVPLYGDENLSRALAEAACRSPEQVRGGYVQGFYEILKSEPDEQHRARLFESTPRAFLDLPEISRFADSDRPALLEEVARALFNRGIDLAEANRPQEAIASYEEVISRFADSDRPAILEEVARALVNRGIDLAEADRPEEAIASYEEVIRRFADSDQPALLEVVARALFNRGIDLAEADRPEEAIASYEEVIGRFADSDRPAILEEVARALVYRGAALAATNRLEEAIASCEEVVNRFADSHQESLLGYVAEALSRKAQIILEHSPQNLKPAIEAAEKAAQLRPENLTDKETLAWVYGLAQRWEEAFQNAAVVVNDEEFVSVRLDSLLAFFIHAAADGRVREALDLLANTPAGRLMEPLVVALKKLAGEKVHAPQEVAEVAKDVLARIAKTRRELEKSRSNS